MLDILVIIILAVVTLVFFGVIEPFASSGIVGYGTQGYIMPGSYGYPYYWNLQYGGKFNGAGKSDCGNCISMGPHYRFMHPHSMWVPGCTGFQPIQKEPKTMMLNEEKNIIYLN